MTNLDHKTFELNIEGSPKKVMNLDGHVNYVLGLGEPLLYEGKTVGYQRVLSITITNGDGVRERRFKFRGPSDVRAGDTVSVGIIQEGDEESSREAAYIALWDLAGYSGRMYNRIDYKDGYIPSKEDMAKVVF